VLAVAEYFLELCDRFRVLSCTAQAMNNEARRATRRQVLGTLSTFGAAALFGCGSTEGGTEASAGASGGNTAGAAGEGAAGAAVGAGGAGAGGETAGASRGGASAGAGGAGSVSWATQGTSVLTGKDYGNPFASGIGTTCNVYKSSTGGPCHATSNLLTRKDVSEGHPGLPMRLELLVVDASCNPVSNATVEIWMCDTEGVYSGDIDGNNDAFCTGGSAAAAAALWGRGIQTAGSDGRVTFDANFPGWYASRATHIHFKISVGTTAYVTSQLFVDEAFKTEIYNSQPNYEPTSGAGYVINAKDMVIQEASLTVNDAVLSLLQQSDGALLAWKAITVNA
jgi:protocatechuate 3,4-dioxygenase beta subunit